MDICQAFLQINAAARPAAQKYGTGGRPSPAGASRRRGLSLISLCHGLTGGACLTTGRAAAPARRAGTGAHGVLTDFDSPANWDLPQRHDVNLAGIPFAPQGGKDLKFLKSQTAVEPICVVIFLAASRLNGLYLKESIFFFHCKFLGVQKQLFSNSAAMILL